MSKIIGSRRDRIHRYLCFIGIIWTDRYTNLTDASYDAGINANAGTVVTEIGWIRVKKYKSIESYTLSRTFPFLPNGRKRRDVTKEHAELLLDMTTEFTETGQISNYSFERLRELERRSANTA